jgi:hypothetical protein
MGCVDDPESLMKAPPTARPPVREHPRHPLEELFAPSRAGRRKHYASWKPGSGAGKRRAVVTMVHNEAVFFPIWLRYYSRFFAADDIYVLDHESTDGSTTGGGFVRIPVAHDSVDHTWMVRTIESLQHELIERYDVVLATDVDEIVAPDPNWGSLGDYIDRFDEEFVNCLGYELLHVRDVEGPFRVDRPVLEQRGYWFANDGYDKPLLSTVPMTWTPGFHSRPDGRMVLDPDLRLIHLHRMDYDVCFARHRWRRSRGWNQRDVAAGWAQHNRIAEGEEFERWFYTDSCFEAQGIQIVLERIPAAWRRLF